jgi:peptidoglycan/LPS O-acetylase OafA/YrhL
MSATTPKSHSFNVALNGYRGVCALMVFVYHVGNAGVMPWPGGSAPADALTFLWSSLMYGVEMFFMISGFVILGSLLRHDSVSSFLRDRVVRIFSAWIPSLLAVTAVCVALKMKMFADVSLAEGITILLANLLLLPPLVPLPLINSGSWSLTYEWVFYLSAAAGLLLIRARPQRSWAVALWILCVTLFVCSFPRAAFFLTGIAVFKYRDWFAARRSWLRYPAVSLLVFLLAWRATGVDKVHLSTTLFDWALDARLPFALIAFAASVHLFASVCVRATEHTRFLEGRTFQFLGTISYSFYLWHVLVMAVVKRIVSPPIVAEYGMAAGVIVFAAVSLAIAVPVAWASTRLFEVRLAAMVKAWWPSRRDISGAVRAA